MDVNVLLERFIITSPTDAAHESHTCIALTRQGGQRSQPLL